MHIWKRRHEVDVDFIESQCLKAIFKYQLITNTLPRPPGRTKTPDTVLFVINYISTRWQYSVSKKKIYSLSPKLLWLLVKDVLSLFQEKRRKFSHVNAVNLEGQGCSRLTPRLERAWTLCISTPVILSYEILASCLTSQGLSVRIYIMGRNVIFLTRERKMK